MVQNGTEQQGELYLEEGVVFSDILKSANKDIKEKMNQMMEYLQMLLGRDYESYSLKSILNQAERGLACCLTEDDIILVGGYKGLLRSILIDHRMKELAGGLFIDFKTMLPMGLRKLIMAGMDELLGSSC